MKKPPPLHAVVLAGDDTILPEHLPATLTGVGRSAGASSIVRIDAHRGRTLREIEMDVILQVLNKHNGDKPKTASELGIALKTLYNKLNQAAELKKVA